jgi:hypothetical protein
MTKQPTSVTATQAESNKKIAEPSASGGSGVDNSADSLPAIDGALFQTLMTHAWQVGHLCLLQLSCSCHSVVNCKSSVHCCVQ